MALIFKNLGCWNKLPVIQEKKLESLLTEAIHRKKSNPNAKVNPC